MTPVAALDPVAATALANGLTTAVGLGPLVCARVVRRRFVSESGRPGVHTTAEWDAFTATLTDEQHEALSDEAGRRGMSRSKVARIYGVKDTCPDCNGTGLVQPSGPQTMLIGATAVKPGKVGDWMMVPPSSVVTNGEWIAQRWEGSTCVERLRILPASILGTITGELVPVMDESQGTGRGVWTVSDAKARVRPDGSSVYPRLLLATDDVTADLVDISAALPFGSWTPGGLALIATDFRPTIDCPNRVDVERDGCGKWWVTLDGTRVSDHRDHVAARTAARRHPLATTVACPLPWPAAPSSPCVTTIDLGESGAA